MTAAIEVEGLWRNFGSTTAVEDLSFSVRQGEVFGFLGPNGAGKTTTIRMLCTLIKATKGTAYIKGLDVSNPQEALKIRRFIGLLPETPGLYDKLSAYRNLDFYARLYEVDERERRIRIEWLLKMLGLWERRDEPVAVFSKGMRQKIAIARAMVHDPLVLFLDEPTASLDPESAKTVRDFILKLKEEKRTIFLSTHNLDEAERLCDRVGIIKSKLIAIGTPDELRSKIWRRRTVIHLVKVKEDMVQAVKNIKEVENLQILENSIICEVDDPDSVNPRIIETLVAAGGKIRYVTELRRSLEDVYLEVVRRRSE
ncbi:MAG: ABC transporter ATP-binding protein [Candidatus Bathyarchaeia archaeon]